MTAFKYRGPNTFHFKRKRGKLDSLRCRMAELRTLRPGGGGWWGGDTGDGEAWHTLGDTFGPWQRVRQIRGGQWSGPWRRVMDVPLRRVVAERAA